MATAATRSNVNRAHTLGQVAQATIIFGFAVVGIEQIGLDLHFLTDIFVVVLGILLAGASLAFGIGARTLVANIIGIQRIRRHCSIGERLQIGNAEGEILELTQTSIVLDTAQGRTVIPAKLFQEQPSQILSDEVIISETKGANNG